MQVIGLACIIWIGGMRSAFIQLGAARSIVLMVVWPCTFTYSWYIGCASPDFVYHHAGLTCADFLNLLSLGPRGGWSFSSGDRGMPASTVFLLAFSTGCAQSFVLFFLLLRW